MAGQTFPEGTREALLFLATAGVAVPVFTRLKVSPVLGFLLGGVLLGPFGLGALSHAVPALSGLAIAESGRIGDLAELGVVFLLFMVGLELSFERLSRLRWLVFGLGALQVCLCAVLIGLCAFALGLGPAPAIVIGFALSLSSTAVVVPVLAERKRLGSAAGRTAFSVLLFQDLAVAPLLFTVSALSAHTGGQSLGSELLFSLAPAALALAIVVVLGRLVLRPLFHVVAATRSTEFFMATCLLVVIGTGAITAASGPVDVARCLHGRAAAGRDRISPRDRGDDRALQRPAARAVLRLDRRRARPVACCARRRSVAAGALRSAW